MGHYIVHVRTVLFTFYTNTLNLALTNTKDFPFNLMGYFRGLVCPYFNGTL